MFERILVPVDFSPSAWQALETARVRFPGAVRTLLYVQPQRLAPPPALELLGSGARLGGNAQALTELEDQLQERETFALALGDPVNEILNAAREKDVELIVMGTHARQGLSHFILGSVAEAVVRRSPVPVLTVRASDQA